MDKELVRLTQEYSDKVFEHLYNNAQSGLFRGIKDKMEWEFFGTMCPDPFPCFEIRIYPNGKGDHSLGESLTSSEYDLAYKEKNNLPCNAVPPA